MRGAIRGAILGLRILPCRLVLFLLPMMLDDATGSSPHNGMMSGHMTDYATDRGSFQATLGLSHSGQQRKTHGYA